MEITDFGFAIIEGDTHLGKWCKQHGRLDFDSNSLPEILSHIKPEHVVINVGANIGCYAYPISKIAKEVICFEPNPDAFECLKYNLGNLPNVSLINMAVGLTKGNVNMVKSENAGASYVEYKKDGEVEIRTLNSFKFPKVDVIFADCEGFEHEMLFGAQQIIERDKPLLFLEINKGALARRNTTPEDIFHFLDTFNYQYRNIYQEQPMEGEQYDIICW